MDPALEFTTAQKPSHKVTLFQSPDPPFSFQGEYKTIIWPHSDIHSSPSEFLHYLMSKVRRQNIFYPDKIHCVIDEASQIHAPESIQSFKELAVQTTVTLKYFGIFDKSLSYPKLISF